MKKCIEFFVMIAFMSISANASAHVWNIGWKANMDGSLTMLGTSYHTGGINIGSGSSNKDDFSLNPAGFIINGTMIGFDNGSVVDLNDCNGPGFGGTSVTSTCAPVLNAFGLDAGIQSIESFVNPNYFYGKYATVLLSPSALAGLGIGQGTNTVSLTTFANNAHWNGLDFNTAGIPLDITIVIPPTTTTVPAPMPLALIGLGLVGLAFSRKR